MGAKQMKKNGYKRYCRRCDALFVSTTKYEQICPLCLDTVKAAQVKHLQQKAPAQKGKPKKVVIKLVPKKNAI